ADGIDNPESNLANITNMVLREGQESVLELLKDSSKSADEKRRTILQIASDANIKLKPDALDHNLLQETFETISLCKASRRILELVLKKEAFNNNLPPFLRTSDLWEDLGDLLAHYLKGLYAQTKKIQDLDQTNLTIQ